MGVRLAIPAASARSKLDTAPEPGARFTQVAHYRDIMEYASPPAGGAPERAAQSQSHAIIASATVLYARVTGSPARQ